MRTYDIEMKLYQQMCSNCPYAKECHENCENCEEFERELERVENDAIK